MDALTALRLQLDWGADEALAETSLDRYAQAPPAFIPALAGEAGKGVEPPTSVPEDASKSPALARSAALAADLAAALAAAAPSLAALAAAMAGFDCPLAHTAGSLVFADGNPEARLMIVGDAPGDEEDRAGKPFVGPAGKLLDRMLASIGLDRSGFHATNLVPWRPPGGRPPTEAELAVCLPFLWRHIALVAPSRLVLLGGVTARAILGTALPPSRLRGRWHLLEVPGLDAPVRALPMAHPLGLIKAPRAKREAWSDLLRLRQALDADIAGASITGS